MLRFEPLCVYILAFLSGLPTVKWQYNVLIFMAQQPLVGQGFLIIGASRWHSDTPQSAGLFWTSDQPDIEISIWHQTTRITDRHPISRPDSNPQSQQTSGRSPTSRTARRPGSARGLVSKHFILVGIMSLILREQWEEAAVPNYLTYFAVKWQ